jgi:hypothetical protein
MTSRRAYSAVLLLAVLAIAAITACSFAVAAPSTGQADGTIRIPLPESDVAVRTDADGLGRFTGTDTQYIGQTGEPSIPSQSVRVLLPPDADAATVEATVTGYRWTGIDGEWDIPPVGALAVGDGDSTCAVSPTDEAIVNARDPGIYESDALFPAEPIVKVDVQEMRGWKMAQVLYAPFAYNPVEKQVFQLSGNAIEVTFETTSFKTSSASADLTSADAVREMTVNFAEMSGEYGGYAVSADTGRYVIITTSAIQAASTKLTDFVASKAARGFTVQVVTDNAWGGGTGNTAAENIRSWLKTNYVSLNIKYALLIGNPNPSSGDVPMKMCYPQKYDLAYPECPTDFYYAELTSNDWDRDGDGKYGEYIDDFLSIPPRVAEVAVGRIPYYGSISDLDHILSKIIDYETLPDADLSWRRHVLLPMKPSDNVTPGYQLGEEIRNTILVPNGWTYHRVYDQYNTYCNPGDPGYILSIPGDTETTPCTVSNVTNAWNASDFGGVFWWTHGSSTSAEYVMDSATAATLDDAHPSFAFQCSCLNGAPETTNNLGYSLLKNGCVSTVSASRVSWYQTKQTSFAGTPTNAGMTFEYASRLIADEMYAGDALNGLKADVSPYDQVLWMNYLDFNLYGDPALGLYTPPLAQTGEATSLAPTSAQLNAELKSLGSSDSAVVSFQWGTASGGPYPNQTDNQTFTAPGGTFSANLSGLTPGTTYYYRARGVGWGTGYGAEMSFTALAPPAVTTDSANPVTAATAQLNGNLTWLGTADNVTVSFQWGLTTAYDKETTPVSENQTGIFSANLGNLKANTTYHFRAKAVGDVTAYGSDEPFTTSTVPPSVATEAAATGVTGARLRGTLVSKGTADNVSVSFVWGPSPGSYTYGELSASVMNTTGSFYYDLTSLPTNTTFYYKAKAEGDGVPVYGLEVSFTTGRLSPAVTTGTVTNRLASSVTLNGELVDRGTGGSIVVHFLWGTADGGPYPFSTPSQPKAGTGAFSADLNGLSPGTTYYFVAIADGGSHGVGQGSQSSFTTLGQPPVVASVTPASGKMGQSLTVTIVGSDFTGATAVTFSGSDVSVENFTVMSATQISAAIRIACDGTAGTRDVAVTTSGGTDTLEYGFTVSNSAPNQPLNQGPADGTSVMTLSPILSSSAFSHPCTSRTHAASQWQVRTALGDYANPIYDSGADTVNLTRIVMPEGKLDGHTDYYWHVRHRDDRGMWSAWSAETVFIRIDFLSGALDGPAAIRVTDSSSRVTGIVGSLTEEQIPLSHYLDGTVTIISPGDAYVWEVVGTGDGSYTFTVIRMVEGQSVAFHADGIPVAIGEVHRYVIDWEVLSQGGKGVTIEIDADGDGTFDRNAVVGAEATSHDFGSETSSPGGTPAWAWALLGVSVVAGLVSVFILWRMDRNKRQNSAVP